jgi:hypothetical protein
MSLWRKMTMKLIKVYLSFMVLVWLPWGLICIFDIDSIAQIIGVVGNSPSANTDIRVMYGGVQLAVGLMALFVLFSPRYFNNLLFCLVFLGSCMALSRSYGLMVDGSSSVYTWGVISFEYFVAISAIAWLRVLPRLQQDD